MRKGIESGKSNNAIGITRMSDDQRLGFTMIIISLKTTMEKYLKKIIELTKEAQDTRSKLEKEIEERLLNDVDTVYETVSKVLDNPDNEGKSVITLLDEDGNCRTFIDVQDGLIGIVESVERIFGVIKIQFGCEDKMNEVQKYRIGKLEDKFEQMTGHSIGIRYVNGIYCKSLDNKYAPSGINNKHAYLELRFKVDIDAEY